MQHIFRGYFCGCLCTAKAKTKSHLKREKRKTMVTDLLQLQPPLAVIIVKHHKMASFLETKEKLMGEPFENCGISLSCIQFNHSQNLQEHLYIVYSGILATTELISNAPKDKFIISSVIICSLKLRDDDFLYLWHFRYNLHIFLVFWNYIWDKGSRHL